MVFTCPTLPVGIFCLMPLLILIFNIPLIVKHSLLSLHPLKNTSQLLKTCFCKPIAHKCSLHLSSSIAYKHMFIAVGDFGARKNWSLEMWHFRFNFPHPTQAKVKFPISRRHSPLLGVFRGVVEVSILSVHNIGARRRNNNSNNNNKKNQWEKKENKKIIFSSRQTLKSD